MSIDLRCSPSLHYTTRRERWLLLELDMIVLRLLQPIFDHGNSMTCEAAAENGMSVCCDGCEKMVAAGTLIVIYRPLTNSRISLLGLKNLGVL